MQHGTIETSNPEFNVGGSVLVFGKSAKVVKKQTGNFYLVDSGASNPQWANEGDVSEDENNQGVEKWDQMMKMMGLGGNR